MRVLGIETSCDETGIAIFDAATGLLANVLYSQVAAHEPFGGVVPELASRDHVRKLLPLLQQALLQAHLTMQDIDGIAYTRGPGLAGALLTGAMLGRTLGWVCHIPTLGVHHLEGHLCSPFLAQSPQFPFLTLLVSGGHTMLIIAKEFGDYQLLGETLDDAAGEAFDKIAKLLGLGYPGGAALSYLAERGDAMRFIFPRPLLNRPGFDFSFSGLKTAVNQCIMAITATSLNQQTKADIAAAFQLAVVETLVIKCERALRATGLQQLVVAGGVSANHMLQQALSAMCTAQQVTLHVPAPIFCTDNGAMIAYAGCQRLLAGEQDDLQVEVLPRWELSELSKIAR